MALDNLRTLEVSPLWIIPFILLLLFIAIAPFIHRHWWEKNYPIVSFSLGLLVLLYYLFNHNASRMGHTALEYFSFISLLASLFVVTGGFLIHLKTTATPLVNTLFLLFGAIIANIIGTTGASILLIRPYLRINKPRLKDYHVIFFIFLVSNIGGVLTPIGDPPLFLGYLRGVPFFWVIKNLWSNWILGVGLTLLVFLGFEISTYLGVREKSEPNRHEAEKARLEIKGRKNAFFLLLILIAVFIVTPWREIIMLSVAAIAYLSADKKILQENEFNFTPIKEVAILFAGIFATMTPALDWLELNSSKIGLHTPGHYYWATGSLSSVLDNAPTYLNFLSAALGLKQASVAELLERYPIFVKAISAGAVFFGAMTYIGNGPNFMIKSIAEHSGAKCPSFFGYIIKYSLPILFPIFTIIWCLFYRTG
ncbi:MAG: sodium:proton antiporter [Candidatus Tectomicrobia bacterium]|uniref:Sodium:proton antiporter n=1 Tax=Tectimicrobiota bacterium TaxID=2528274 RepID=A0A933LQF0_UNCTE|nr:sodium:proton antiporter [Candidatus Tectomicrobia bacterium]